jgi:hypothetical protein
MIDLATRRHLLRDGLLLTGSVSAGFITPFPAARHVAGPERQISINNHDQFIPR